MRQLDLGAPTKRPEVPDGQRVRSARWCFKGEASSVRARYVVRHLRPAVGTEAFASTPLLESERVFIANAYCAWGYEVISGDLSVAFNYTPSHVETGTIVEPPPELKTGTRHRVETSASTLLPSPSSASISLILCVELGAVVFRTQPS